MIGVGGNEPEADGLRGPPDDDGARSDDTGVPGASSCGVAGTNNPGLWGVAGTNGEAGLRGERRREVRHHAEVDAVPRHQLEQHLRPSEHVLGRVAPGEHHARHAELEVPQPAGVASTHRALGEARTGVAGARGGAQRPRELQASRRAHVLRQRSRKFEKLETQAT